MPIQPGVGYTFSASSQGENLTIEQPWAPIALYQVTDNDHPFKVDIYWDEDSAMFFATVTAGTINNIVPVIWGGGPIDDLLTVVPKPPMGLATVQVPPGDIYVYIKSGKNATTNEFPDSDRNNPGYPEVWFSTTQETDTDDYAYIMLAYASVTVSTKKVNSLSQFVTGSLWASRIKVGNLTAKYFYARI